ncbi:ankyrin repeat domain-containing protein [Fuerstiella marisgermanici]|uniref:Ankyrin repeat protein n=1 Tax=Fuerstiella marisgermanici TaxID=1891926 RepID=A0A1P8WH47_9PLAN|nr:ankyrin repeat domain-containing protein [Fuerstiella marisgermanici]APZ93347.1 ankyrin repeat protein [Fuerstiella marisgermanici]
MDIHLFTSNGDIEAVQEELQKSVPVDSRDERDFTPLAYAASSPDADESLLRLLLDSGADVNAPVDQGKKSPFDLAACSGSSGKVMLLANAGANVDFVSPSGYTVVVNIMYSLFDSDDLVPMIKLLVSLGADTDTETQYGESPLSVSSRFGRFDAVQALLEAGADPSRLQWTEPMNAVALRSIDDLKQLFPIGDSGLEQRDRWGRTPWLLASVVGDIEKATFLLSAGANIEDRERGGSTALAICASRGNAEMLSWLISSGAEIEAVDDAQNTPLMLAAQEGHDGCVRVLLDAGAKTNRKNEYDDSTMSMASTEQVMRLLIAAGEDIGEINTELKRILLGLEGGKPLNISEAEYRLGCRPRYGKSNPEVIDVAFWHEMVRCGISAYEAKSQFGDEDNMAEATWCFSRYGVSFTELPNGRFVQIGGEHEDFYDPDFCIYNDVLIHERGGQIQIMGYPKEVFPPTDFHSATFIDGFIYIVGSLGYHGERKFGTTLVYRLNCETWAIESIPTTGASPGWIHDHKAMLQEPHVLSISGGKVCIETNGHEELVENSEIYLLNLTCGEWTRKT